MAKVVVTTKSEAEVALFDDDVEADSPVVELVNRGRHVAPFKTQLLKWIGNKQRFAHEIIRYFPDRFGTYREPFLGSAGVLATLAPKRAIGSDSFAPLVEIWQCLRRDPDELKRWYAERWNLLSSKDKLAVYEEVKASLLLPVYPPLPQPSPKQQHRARRPEYVTA